MNKIVGIISVPKIVGTVCLPVSNSGGGLTSSGRPNTNDHDVSEGRDENEHND